MPKKITAELAFTLRGRGQHAWPYVYAHRAAEDLLDTLNPEMPRESRIPPDLVSANLPLDSIDDGEHSCTILDEAALLFLWHPKGEPRKGLVLLASDEEGVRETRARMEMG